MIRVRSIGHAAVLVLVVSALEPTAHADSDSGKAVAEALFRDAKQLMESGDVATACPKFAESLSIDRTLGTLLYLGACHEQQGRTATAWSELSSALAWAQRSGQGERVAFAQKHIEALEARLSFIVINAPAVPGLQLKVDDAPLSAAAIGTPLPLDPGSHTLEASAPNSVPWRETMTVPAEPGRIAIDVPPLAPAPVAPPVTPVTLPPAAPLTSSVESGTTATAGAAGHRAATWTAVAVAGAGVAVGSVFGVLTFSARDSAKSLCTGNLCSSTGLDDISRARTYATVSTIGFGVGLAGAALATYFILTSNHDDSSHGTATTIRTVTAVPELASHEAGLSLQGKF